VRLYACTMCPQARDSSESAREVHSEGEGDEGGEMSCKRVLVMMGGSRALPQGSGSGSGLLASPACLSVSLRCYSSAEAGQGTLGFGRSRVREHRQTPARMARIAPCEGGAAAGRGTGLRASHGTSILISDGKVGHTRFWRSLCGHTSC
jgi:hypothetical protein